jgi:hypothetical protein
MIAFVCVALIAAGARGQQPTPTITLRRGLVMTHSVRVAPRTYRLADSSLDKAVITIRGDTAPCRAPGLALRRPVHSRATDGQELGCVSG